MTNIQPAGPRKTNGMAVTGFVLSFFCGVLGIIFSAIGMAQTSKDPNQGGRGLAIAGLVISIVSMVLTWIYWGAVFSSTSEIGRAHV